MPAPPATAPSRVFSATLGTAMNDVQVSSAERDISHVHGSVPASLGSMRTLRRNEFITPRSPSRVLAQTLWRVGSGLHISPLRRVPSFGSIPLSAAETVFRTRAAATGPDLKRLP